jgi:hypothetical protein
LRRRICRGAVDDESEQYRHHDEPVRPDHPGTYEYIGADR